MNPAETAARSAAQAREQLPRRLRRRGTDGGELALAALKCADHPVVVAERGGEPHREAMRRLAVRLGAQHVVDQLPGLVQAPLRERELGGFVASAGRQLGEVRAALLGPAARDAREVLAAIAERERGERGGEPVGALPPGRLTQRGLEPRRTRS